MLNAVSKFVLAPAIGTPHHKTHDQNTENRAQKPNPIGEDGRELGAAFDLLLLLLGRHLRRAGTLFDLLAHEFTPIDTLVDRKADSNAEYRDKRER